MTNQHQPKLFNNTSNNNIASNTTPFSKLTTLDLETMELPFYPFDDSEVPSNLIDNFEEEAEGLLEDLNTCFESNPQKEAPQSLKRSFSSCSNPSPNANSGVVFSNKLDDEFLNTFLDFSQFLNPKQAHDGEPKEQPNVVPEHMPPPPAKKLKLSSNSPSPSPSPSPSNQPVLEEKRGRNNAAAKKYRDKLRQKAQETENLCQELFMDNQLLKSQIDSTKKDLAQLSEMLKRLGIPVPANLLVSQ